MNRISSPPHPDFRPWFREPWVWVLIAFPLTAVLGCAVTIWLALSHPDYLVVDEQQYEKIESELEAVSQPNSGVPDEPATKEDGDG